MNFNRLNLYLLNFQNVYKFHFGENYCLLHILDRHCVMINLSYPWLLIFEISNHFSAIT